MSDWIDIFDRRPLYGEPVFLVCNGVTQNVTYMLNGSDHSSDWFEPYFFNHDDDCKFLWDNATHWMPLPAPPNA
jgi:hypothetical protein